VGQAIRTYGHGIDFSFDDYRRVLAAEEIHYMADLRVVHRQRRLIFLVLLGSTSVKASSLPDGHENAYDCPLVSF
jgi:hypothetical protein